MVTGQMTPKKRRRVINSSIMRAFRRWLGVSSVRTNARINIITKKELIVISMF